MSWQFYQLTAFNLTGLKRTHENAFEFTDADHRPHPRRQLCGQLDPLVWEFRANNSRANNYLPLTSKPLLSRQAHD
jgi:hypothetical protein